MAFLAERSYQLIGGNSKQNGLVAASTVGVFTFSGLSIFQCAAFWFGLTAATTDVVTKGDTAAAVCVGRCREDNAESNGAQEKEVRSIGLFLHTIDFSRFLV